MIVAFDFNRAIMRREIIWKIVLLFSSFFVLLFSNASYYSFICRNYCVYISPLSAVMLPKLPDPLLSDYALARDPGLIRKPPILDPVRIILFFFIIFREYVVSQKPKKQKKLIKLENRIFF